MPLRMTKSLEINLKDLPNQDGMNAKPVGKLLTLTVYKL